MKMSMIEAQGADDSTAKFLRWGDICRLKGDVYSLPAKQFSLAGEGGEGEPTTIVETDCRLDFTDLDDVRTWNDVRLYLGINRG